MDNFVKWVTIYMFSLHQMVSFIILLISLLKYNYKRINDLWDILVVFSLCLNNSSYT